MIRARRQKNCHFKNDSKKPIRSSSQSSSSLSSLSSSLSFSWVPLTLILLLYDYGIACKKLAHAAETSNIDSSANESCPRKRRRRTKSSSYPLQTNEVLPHFSHSDSLSSSEEELSTSKKTAFIQPPFPSITVSTSLPQDIIQQLSPVPSSTATGPLTADDGVLIENQGIDGVTLASSEDIEEIKKFLIGFQEKVFGILEKQSIELTEVKALVHNLRQTSSGHPILDFSGIPTLPISDESELKNLEDWLAINANTSLLIEYLSLVGGSSIEKNTRKILKKVIGNDLGRRINFTGKGDKVALKNLRLLHVVKDTSGITLGESTSEGAKTDGGEEVESKNVTKNYTLTGNPQIDYVHDPNLPRELNGYNLSSYPFYSRVPASINFSCDGLKDGFYSNIEHKCQVYHHCIFGTRHDFLCANFTAFDQKTFICQFVSEVDCPNSALFFHRNDALYVTKSTTEAPPPPRARYSSGNTRRLRPAVQYNPDPQYETPSESKPAKPSETREPEDHLDESEEDYPDPPPRRLKNQRRNNRPRCRKGRGRCRNRRPRPRPRPVDYYEYDDYYDDDDYDEYENEYYDERPKRPRGKGKRNKPGSKVKVASSQTVESLTSERTRGTTVASLTTVSTTPMPYTEPLEESNNNNAPLDPLDIDPTALAKTREEIFTKSRPPPRIRPPVPKNERNKYDAMQGRAPPSTEAPSTKRTSAPASSAKPGEYDEYYEDDYQGQSQQQAAVTTKPIPSTEAPTPTAAPTTASPRQRLYNFRTPKSKSTTTVGTTPTASTTTTTTTVATSRAPSRPSPSKAPITTTTTTTTEAPEYEYEYAYEDELPPSSSTERGTPLTTTTTTTTTTQKPSRINIRGKRPNSSSSVQTSTSVTYQEDPLLQVTSNSRDDETDTSQNAINRRRSSWTRNQPVRTPLTAAIPSSSPNDIPSSTSERFQTRQVQQERVYQAPVITVKSAPTSQSQRESSRNISTDPPATKTRPSRFWQRPSKVVASSTTTTTTEATPADTDYADYEDEPETVPATRYNTRQRAGSSSSTSSYQNPLVSSGNSEESYNSQYTQNGNQYSSSNSNPQQYLRSTVSQNTYRQPQSPQLPVISPTRGTIEQQQNNYVSQYGPSPSSIGTDLTSSMRPEFISLLREDEDPYYDLPVQQTQLQNPHQSSRSSSSSSSSSNSNSRRLPPQQRTQYYGSQPPYHQSQKNLYSAAQETYATFVAPPSRFSVDPAFMNFNDYNMNTPQVMFAVRKQNQPQHNMMFQM